MLGMALPTQEQVTDKLRAVIDPELRRNIVELGMVRSIDIADDGRVGVIVSLTTPGCPIRSHFQQAVAQNVARARGRHRGRGRVRRPLRGRAREPAAVAGPQPAARGRARPGQERDLRRLRQGRRRQVDDDRQPRRCARRRRALRRRARLRRLRLLDPAHARRRGQARRERAPQDHPDGGARRRQGDVDRLLRRGERRGRLARPDAPQGDPAVPRGRRLGRARLPAARPPARAPATSR